MSDNPVISKILEKRKKMNEKYHIKQTPDGKKWIFLNDKKKVVNVLTFIRLPDVYYDKLQKTEVTTKTSALVSLIMDRIYKRSEILITDWKGFSKCKNKKCRKCLTKQVAIPKSGKVLLKYDRDYVLHHLNKFEFKIKCKLFELDDPKKFEILYIPISYPIFRTRNEAF